MRCSPRYIVKSNIKACNMQHKVCNIYSDYKRLQYSWRCTRRGRESCWLIKKICTVSVIISLYLLFFYLDESRMFISLWKMQVWKSKFFSTLLLALSVLARCLLCQWLLSVKIVGSIIKSMKRFDWRFTVSLNHSWLYVIVFT